MYGLFLARELFPDGVVYYSEDTHYSVGKILRLLHVRNIMIKSRPDGSMDVDDLHETLRIAPRRTTDCFRQYWHNDERSY
jgi:histidine decarboxylase